MLPYKAIEEYCLYSQQNSSFAARTYKNYERALKRYCEFLIRSGQFEIEKVDVNVVNRFLVRINSYYSTDTLYCTKLAIRNFHQYLTMKYDIDDPTQSIRVSIPKKRLPVYATHDEIEKIMSYYDESDDVGLYNKAILEMLYGTGVRISELANLTMSHIELNEGIIKVRGKGNKDRYIPIPGRILDILIKYIDTVRKKWNVNNLNFLFINRFGLATSQNYIRVMTKNVVSKVGIAKNLTPHKFRHTYATHLLEGGANLIDISELLGHSSVSTTQIYTHVDIDMARKEYLSAFEKMRSKLAKNGFVSLDSLATIMVITMTVFHIFYC